MSRVIIDQEEGLLYCPGCIDTMRSHPYLHHGQVTVFHRERDDAPVKAVTIVDGQAIPSIDRASPGSRRGGISIKFECEHCDEVSVLTITQHKGSTYIEWEPQQ